MSGKVVGGYVRRSNWRVLVAASAALAVAAVFAPFAIYYCTEVSHGPIQLDADALKAAADPKARPTGYVVVNGDAVIPTRFVKTDKGVQGEEDVLIRVGDHYLLTTTWPNNVSVRAFGCLTRHTGYQSKTVIPTVVEESPELQGKILPYTLSVRGPNEPNALALVLSMPVVLGASAGTVLLLLLPYLNRSQAIHPFLRSLERFGAPEEVAASIDEEGGGAFTEKVGGVLLTPSWLICAKNARRFSPRAGASRLAAMPRSEKSPSILYLLIGQFTAFRLAELVWAYKMVPTKGSSIICRLRLFDRDGWQVEIPSRHEGELDQIVAWISHYAPWILLNFKREYEIWWLQDRPAIVALVDQRRRELPRAAAPLARPASLAGQTGGGPPVPLPMPSAPLFLERITGQGSWDNMIGSWLGRGSRRLLMVGFVGCFLAAVAFTIAIVAWDHPIGDVDPEHAFVESLYAGLGFSVVGVIALSLGFAWHKRPALHPIGRSLQRFGDPAAVAEAVEAEAKGEQTAAAGRVLLTSSWLICPIQAIHAATEHEVVIDYSFPGMIGTALFYGTPAVLTRILGPFSVFRLRDLVWVYKLVPILGKKGPSVLRLFDRHGYRVVIPSGDEGELDQIVFWIRRHVPWVLLNYRTDLDSYWKTNRPALAALVDQRRRDLEAGSDLAQP